MEYAAVVLAPLLAAFGVILGLKFRFRVLLVFALIVFGGSLLFALILGLGLLHTLLAILAAEAILQVSYFVGLVVRAGFRAAQRKLPAFLAKISIY